MIDFLLPAFLAGLAIATTASCLGVFIVWRKMAYFGDTLSHASLLGVTMGLIFQINLNVALLICCICVALLLLVLERNRTIGANTLLGILSYSALSLSLVTISFFDQIRVDLMSYLFGDLLAIKYSDLIWIYLGAIIVIGVIRTYWHQLLNSTIHADIASVEGVNNSKMKLILILLIAITIAVSMKFIGALIITALLIIPAAAARKFSKTPEQMLLFTILLSIISLCVGLLCSWQYDTPTGPSVILSASLLFFIIQVIPIKS